MYVYADVLMALNWIMNIVILLGACKITGIAPRMVRLSISAGIGALIALGMLWPYGAFLRLAWVKILVSCLMAAVAFYPLPWRRWPVVLSVFYLMSFTLGGLVLAMLYFADTSTYLTDGVFTVHHASWAVFLSAAVILACLGHWTWGRLAARRWQPKFVMPINIFLSGKSVRILALMDSGNALKDPISHMPVVVVEYACLRPLLPPEVCALFDITAEEAWLDSLQDLPHEWVSRLHILPYSSLGRKGGLIIGFRPDCLTIEEKGNILQCPAAIIGIHAGKFAGNGEYGALLHPALVHGAVICNKEAS